MHWRRNLIQRGNRSNRQLKLKGVNYFSGANCLLTTSKRWKNCRISSMPWNWPTLRERRTPHTVFRASWMISKTRCGKFKVDGTELGDRPVLTYHWIEMQFRWCIWHVCKMHVFNIWFAHSLDLHRDDWRWLPPLWHHCFQGIACWGALSTMVNIHFLVFSAYGYMYTARHLKLLLGLWSCFNVGRLL